MSNTNREEQLASLEIIDIFTQEPEQASSDQLYISMTDLMVSQLGYHPALESQSLAATDQARLSAILGSLTIEQHFVQALYQSIKEAIKPQHKVIRLALNGCDSATLGGLIGGECELSELNPAMGSRGVVRYASTAYRSVFALECEVIKQLRADGFNIEVVVPFVRALRDAATIIDRLAEQGLPRGLNGFKLLYSCDVPSAVLLAERLIQYFDGMVVQVENLAQFTLGIDKRNAGLEQAYDVQNGAVLQLIKQAVKVANKANKPYLVVCPDLEPLPLLREVLIDLKGPAVAIVK